VSSATVGRMCRRARISYVHVGGVRRFNVETVRSLIRATGPAPISAPCVDPRVAAGREGAILS
jgi:hypothetical protein